MQYLVAGMMFGQGNYLAHYGRKGMKWGKNIFGDEATGEYSGRVRTTNPVRKVAKPNYTISKSYANASDRINSAFDKAKARTSAAYTRAQTGYVRPSPIQRAARVAGAAAKGYTNRAIDAATNRDEYRRLQEAIRTGADSGTLAMLQEQYDSHWMTRAQKGVQRGMDFVNNFFTKLPGQIKDAAGKAVSYAKSTWNQIKGKAAVYVDKAKQWLNMIWNRVSTGAKDAYNSAKSSVGNAYNSAKGYVGNAYNSARSSVGNAYNNARSSLARAYLNYEDEKRKRWQPGQPRDY